MTPIRGLKTKEAARFFGIGVTKFYEVVLPKWGHKMPRVNGCFDLNDLNAVFDAMKAQTLAEPPALDGRTRTAKALAAQRARRTQEGK